MDWEKATASIQEISKNTFGTECLYVPFVGVPQTILGIFDNDFVDIKTGSGAIVNTLRPRLAVKLSDFNLKPTNKDKVTVKNTNYKIYESQEDGQGGSMLVLEKIL